MAYVKNTWVDREGQTRYHETIDDDGALIFTPDYEKVTELGTPVNADNMNHIEDGIVDHENRITVLEEGGDASNFLNKSQITNCLLEVPQNIKVELSNGTLTLKAGSKVIVPNGANKFDEVVINSDINHTYNWVPSSATYQKVMVYVYVTGKGLDFRTIETSFSGTTKPTAGSYQWYDTTNNKVVRHNDVQTSFPIAIITQGSDGVTKSIDQVFNGLGYIGNTIFCDKGVKGLIPNGRNEDGSLKNIEFITSKVLVQTRNLGGSGNLVIASNFFSNFAVADYDYNTNFVYASNGNQVAYSTVGTWSADNTGRITSFQTKLPVRLLTYDDIKVNNPYFLGQYIWSEFAPDNLSWLKSGGQWNSGTGYQSFYDWILANANANKAGFKKSTASYTDYDFVVNTSAKTFRLPVKVKGKMGEAVVGNGITLGLTNGITNVGLYHNSQVGLNDATSLYGKPVNTAIGATTVTGTGVGLGVTTDPAKSGLILDNTGLSLYFYVGETVKDALLINAGQIASNFADKLDRGNKSEIVSWCMPDYSTVITGLISPFTAPTDGLISWNNAMTANCTINGNTFYVGGNDIYNEGNVTLLLSKNDVISFSVDGGTPCFVSLKGAK